MLAKTATRSRGSPQTHRKFERQAEDRLEWYASRPHLIGRRLKQLDEEWDIERAIQANAATLALTGTALSMTHDRRWASLLSRVFGGTTAGVAG
jgi:hypothetical protein